MVVVSEAVANVSVSGERSAGLDLAVVVFVRVGDEVRDVKIHSRVRRVHAMQNVKCGVGLLSDAAVVLDAEGDALVSRVVAGRFHYFAAPLAALRGGRGGR